MPSAFVDVQTAIIDSECVAWDPEKKQILPFQVLTTRKKKDVDAKGMASRSYAIKWGASQDPDGEIENSGKSIFEIRIPNFCYTFYIFHNFYMVADLLQDLNGTEIRDSDFKITFPGIFNFTVGILAI